MPVKNYFPLFRLSTLITLLMALVPGMVQAAPYELGQGYKLPLLGLTAGGYATLLATDLKGESPQAAVEDLSLFLHADPAADWHFFSEIEVGNLMTYQSGRMGSRGSDLDIERLYIDHNLSPRGTLRIGKFLTPIGRWNTIHADPLVWSASRPLTTSAAFARNASGLMYRGSEPLRDASFDYQVYVDDSAALDPSKGHEFAYLDTNLKPNPPDEFRNGVGIHLDYRSFSFANPWSVGLSAARFRLVGLPGYKDLLGADFHIGDDNMELTGEAVYRKGVSGNEYGWFLQGVAPIYGAYYGVITHEHYKAEQFSEAVDWTGLGITYRPTPPLSIKIERRLSQGETGLVPAGWLLTGAIMF